MFVSLCIVYSYSILLQIVRGYRELPYIKENPQWWVLELVDGFGSHITNVEANMERSNNKILSLKEEGDSSHINQAYDRLTARSDKSVNREALIWMQRDKATNAHTIDQWDLISCGMATVRQTDEDRSIWENSFIATNTKPSKMIPFIDWIKKIESHLFSSDSFDLRDTINVDKYSLLPGFWQAMSPEEKRKAVGIVNKYEGNAWGLDCCVELSTELAIPIKDLNQLQPCIFCAIDDPSHLDRGVEEDAPLPTDVPPEVAAAEEARNDATAGLSFYLAKPDGVKGEKLLAHLYQHIQKMYKDRKAEFGVSKHLDVEVRTPHQQTLMELDYEETIMATIMDDINAGVSKRKAIKTRLNNLGQIAGQSAVINDSKTNDLLKFRLSLMMSQAHAEELGKKEKATKKKAAQGTLLEIVPKALELYAKGETGRPLTKIMIEAIISIVFSETFPAAKYNKPDMVAKINQLAEESPGKILEATKQYPYDQSKPPALPPATTNSPDSESEDSKSAKSNSSTWSPENSHKNWSPEAASKGDAMDDMDEFFDAVAPVNDVDETIDVPPAISLRRWLLSRCTKATIDLKLSCNSIAMAKLIVGLVEEIRIHGKDKYGSMNIPQRLSTIILSYLKRSRDSLALIKEFRDEVEEKMLDFVDDVMMTAEGLEEFM